MSKEQKLLRFKFMYLVTIFILLWLGADKLYIISSILLAIYIEVININWRFKE